MNVLIAGGTGLIGRALTEVLSLRGDAVTVLTRQTSLVGQSEKVKGEAHSVDFVTDLAQIDTQIDAVINLTGEPIADKRWTEKRKQLLESSRIETTRALVDWCKKLAVPPSVLISGSAIGYYGASLSGDRLVEGDAVQPGFTHKLCDTWEAEARKLTSEHTRVCMIRTGVVLAPKGGALGKMLPAFKLGLGGRIASGKQWFSWVHLKDVVQAIVFLMDNPKTQGVYNVTAPQAVNNQAFVRRLGAVLHRPVILPVPSFVFSLMLGEGAELLTQGQNVYPERLLDEGFSFSYPQLEGALLDLLA